jgi:exodeoxyribonuclease VII large subunit
MVASLQEICAEGVDVVVLARGGGSFDDLLPFSDERLVRAVAACPVPVVSAVGHEQDTPLCDLAADVRASTPTHAGRLVVPDLDELVERLLRSRLSLVRGTRRAFERDRDRLHGARDRLRRAPLLLVERKLARVEAAAGRLRALAPQATLERGYAIVRAGAGGAVVRDAATVAAGAVVDVQLARGGLTTRVEETR